MKKAYLIPCIIFGLGIGIALICIFYFTSLQTIQIEYRNNEIVIKEEGYNLEEIIKLDEVKEIEYIENDVLLYDSTKVRGPIKPHKKIPRSQIMKENVASSRGVDTREFAAGEGYSELFGKCKVYIFWNQCSYIAIKTKDSYILLNKKGDEQTYEFYSQLMEDLE